MRTLSRPMFNMGGPIKQGIMNGIREPHAGGGRAAALVGNPVYPQTGGREHHGWSIPLSIAYQGIKSVGTAATRRAAQEAAARAALSGGLKKGLTTASGTGINAAKQGFWRSAWEGDPLVRSVKWLNKTLRSPTAKGWAEKAAKTVVSPTGVIGAGWLGSSLLGGDKEVVDPPTGLNKAGGFPSAAVKEKATMSQGQKDAFAMAQRTKRVQKYLDMMGYDRSKKTAIADALIDASKLVSDRGTLDLKNINRELINPVIQATSKRLDKPEQIREAVGLMMTKAGLEKEMYEAKPGTVLKNVQDMVKSGQYTEEEAWAIATKGSQGAVADLQSAISTGKVDAANWPSFVMSTGALHGEEVTHVTDAQLKELYKDLDNIPSAMEIITEREKTEIVPDGIYVIGQETIRINGGKKTQIK